MSVERAAAIARQIELAAVFADRQTLAVLARAAEGEARAELTQLAIDAGGLLHEEDVAEPLPDDALDEPSEQAQIELERERWGAPFTAWRLGDRARTLPEAERGPILDRAIAEFDAIALTPVSPGNDEGPFWAIAEMLDEPRVRRALAVVDRMEGADWKGDLGASRASLITRLALFGHADEAEEMIPRIGVTDSLATHWRAVAWGGVFGARLLLDPTARFEALFAATSGDPTHMDLEWRFRVLSTMASLFDGRAAPDAANAEALIDLVRTFEPKLRRLALDDLVANLLGSLPQERWLDVIVTECEEQERVEALINLATALRDSGRDPTPALRPLLAYLEEQPCAEPVWTFRDLCGFRAWIAPEDAIGRWNDFLRHAGRGSDWHAVDDVRKELPEILAWLAGPEALLAVGRSVARALRLGRERASLTE